MSTNNGQIFLPQSGYRIIATFIILLTAACGFSALGVWQLERREWKVSLIEQVNSRIHAVATPAPGPETWKNMTSNSDEAYRHLSLRGSFLHDLETPVRASTDYGSGYWIMTPFVCDRGFVVLVNRGFVPASYKDAAMRPDGQTKGEVQLTGLLRVTESMGQWLRANDPEKNNWYSRDVVAIAARHGLRNVAPYFVDVDAVEIKGGLPIGGLTVVAFPNNHLAYALTWFGLSILSLSFLGILLKNEARHHSSPCFWKRARKP